MNGRLALGAATELCAVIGHPVGHSLSPAIHNAAFAALDLDLAYLAFDLAPADLPAAIAGFRALGMRGLSVTIPHKQAILPLLDEVDPLAASIGAVNTVVRDGDRLRGLNSDAAGVLGALRAAGHDPAGKRIAVLGAGGSARAAAFAVALEGGAADVWILARRQDAAVGLMNAVKAAAPRANAGAAGLDTFGLSCLAKVDIVIHTTPVGMARGGADDDGSACLVPGELLRPGLAVFDIVYTPRETELLQRARAAGSDVVEGLEMFLGQAAVQFEAWTGQPAPLDVMREVALARLDGGPDPRQ